MLVQLAALIPTWYFWSKGKKILDVVASKKNVNKVDGEYGVVEQEAFLVGDEDEIELDEEQDKKGELEAS